MIEAGCHVEQRPSWIRRIRYLWKQDDACARTDTPALNWFILFSDEIPRFTSTYWIASFDAGDTEYWLGMDGRVLVCSYPGNCAIGRLPGPGIALGK